MLRSISHSSPHMAMLKQSDKYRLDVPFRLSGRFGHGMGVATACVYSPDPHPTACM